MNAFHRKNTKLLAPLFAALLPPIAVGQDFRIVALPDTQFYSQDYPQLYFGQTQWIVDRMAADNIRFVTHLGDLVNEAATLSQWSVARQAMNLLDVADVPYGTCVGNHDVLYPGDYFDPEATNYRANFGPQYYAAKPWYRGSSPSELSNWQVIDVDGTEFLFLHLMVETPAEELAWAQSVLNQHRDKATWISTHRYLYLWGPLGGGRYDDFNYFFEPPYVPDGIKADDFFRNFVAANRQVYMVACGHCDGEFRQTSTNNYGLPVHEMLADYQDTYGNGGNGLLRIVDVRPDTDRLEVQTYSPTLDSYRTGDESQFILGVDFDQYVSGTPFLQFRQGLDGYAGTEDTWVDEDEPGSSHGGSDKIIVDDDIANNWFTDYPAHGLLRFGEMFRGPVYEGEAAPTRIPYGATIESATLTLNLLDDTDLGDPRYWIYRMTTQWSESSTWSSLGGGVDVGVDTDPNPVGWFQGDNDPDYDFTRVVDVTGAVQAWCDGASNFGFGILPEQMDFYDDGIELRSSENGDPVLRPSLEVEFHFDLVNVPPTIDTFLTTPSLTVEAGDEADLTFAATDPNPLDPLTFLINGVEVGYATGSGQVDHSVLFEDLGSYLFTAEVSDDETTVPAGQLLIVVVPRTDDFDQMPGPPKKW